MLHTDGELLKNYKLENIVFILNKFIPLFKIASNQIPYQVETNVKPY